MDFGTMLRLFSGAPAKIRNKLANDLGVSSRVLESWLVTINTVRNICAHHGRLWNRGIGTRPIIPKRSKHPEWHEPFSVRSDNMFGILTILSYLLEHIAPETFWRERLFKLLAALVSVSSAAWASPKAGRSVRSGNRMRTTSRMPKSRRANL